MASLSSEMYARCISNVEAASARVSACNAITSPLMLQSKSALQAPLAYQRDAGLVY